MAENVFKASQSKSNPKRLAKISTSLQILNKFSFLVPPSFTIVPRGAAEPSGSSPVYNCQASGDPVPTISWTKVSSRQPPTEQLRNGSLWIKNIQKADEGRYTCSASNSVKTITKEITISVYSKFIQSMYSWRKNHDGEIIPKR